MSVMPSLVETVRREIAEAPHGHKSVVAGRWAEVLGKTAPQVYRLIADSEPRRARSKKAARPEYREWAKTVYVIKKRPPEGAGDISTDQAVRLGVMWGDLPEATLEVPPGTFDRIARDCGLSRKTKRRNRYQASRPNLAHHFDASSSKHLYIHRRAGDDFVLRLHRPGAGTQGYKNKPVPCDRLRPWVYGLTDDHSGRFVCRYIAAHGESMADSLSFLQYAWSEIGLPENLLADQGVLKKGLPSQDLIKRLDVELPEMMPYAKEAHGKIERPWRTLWQRFEKPLFASDWERFETTLSELNRMLNNFLATDYNQMPHRFERDITRMQAWKRVSHQGGIVTIPENALATAAVRKKRKVGSDGILQYEGGLYEVKGLHEAWVWVFEGVFEDRLIVQEIVTGKKYEVNEFKALEFGEYRAHPDTPHQKAVKEAAELSVPDGALLYMSTPEKNTRILEMPIRETERAVEDPFDVTAYSGLDEAIEEVTSIIGTSIPDEEREVIGRLIEEHGLKKDYVQDLALELRAAIEIRRGCAG